MFQHSGQSFLLKHLFLTVVLLFVFHRNVTRLFDRGVAFAAAEVDK